ncbi:hypothetical protein JJV70_09170 [Streptomyces sp. JJ66]|uniref:hypothetical protein n=1 Tax=Streptomyces sp. JJ66 TaxID=2803843 RepID=UPI001C55B2A6|nr:hypothetical protein [Streptomyces sp. JJ66]MBW1602277.1 hypothetical protein [Streptomyces sp. JJ66]
MTRHQQQEVTEADALRSALQALLAEKGITLPSLRVDAASCAARSPRPLIELGRVNLSTARALVEVLRASTLQPETGR